jgi:aerobic carbon-monoxide dehydrogenase medium subunit
VRIGRRQGMDLALTGAAAFLALSENGEDVLEGRLALASVAPTPLRARKAEEILCSGPIQENRIQEAAEAAAMESSPIGDMRASQSYRKEMVKVLAARCLRMALKIAKERIPG